MKKYAIVLILINCLFYSCKNEEARDKISNNERQETQNEIRDVTKKPISRDTLFSNFIAGMSWQEYENSINNSLLKNPNFITIFQEFTSDEIDVSAQKGYYMPGYEIIHNNKSYKFKLSHDRPANDVIPYSEISDSTLQIICLEYYDSINKSFNIEKKTFDEIIKIYESKYGKAQKKVEKIEGLSLTLVDFIKNPGGIRQTISWKNKPNLFILVEKTNSEHSFKIFYLSKILQKIRENFLLEVIQENEKEKKEKNELLRRKKINGYNDL